MMMHRFHLAILRNRNNIIYSVATTVLLSTLILTLMILFQILRQNDRIEQTIKGLSCVSLIPSKDRTVINVSNCIKKNDTKPDDKFQFTPPSSSTSSPAKTTFNESIPPPVPAMMKVPMATSPSLVLSVQTIVPQIPVFEYRTNPVTDKPEFRVVGDTLWQVIQ